MNHEDFFKVVDLDKELADCKYNNGTFDVISHPLVISAPYHSAMNHILNTQLLHKKKAVEDALKNSEYGKYVFIHERPYRINAFLEIDGEVELSPKEFNSILRQVWMDSENIFEYFYEWEELWGCSVRDMVMEKSDTKEFSKLPEVITVYRGQDRDYDLGMSWTTNKDKAIWFSQRFSKNGEVLTGKVLKENVLAYFNGRNESEIVVLPQNVEII